MGRALEVAPFEGRQNGFLDEVGVNVGVLVSLECKEWPITLSILVQFYIIDGSFSNM